MERRKKTPFGRPRRKDLHGRDNALGEMELLRSIYKDLLLSRFPERHGIRREALEQFFVKLAGTYGEDFLPTKEEVRESEE